MEQDFIVYFRMYSKTCLNRTLLGLTH